MVTLDSIRNSCDVFYHLHHLHIHIHLCHLYHHQMGGDDVIYDEDLLCSFENLL